MGTPRFAAEILDELAEFHEIAAVYTRPDAVRGRGKALVPSPVKEVAERRGLPVRTPRTLRDAAVLSELAAFAPDVICVAAYGAILPKEVLDLPPFGCLNVHGSLLPRWRGAAPIERAILAGDEEIGVCIMALEEGLSEVTISLVHKTQDPMDELCGKVLEECMAHMQHRYPDRKAMVEEVAQIWFQYVSSRRGKRGWLRNPTPWAAALEVVYCKEAGLPALLREVAAEYGVRADAISRRARMMMQQHKGE